MGADRVVRRTTNNHGQRTAAVLRWAGDLTEAEIARIMGVRRSTVSVTLAKARASLGRLLPVATPEPVAFGGPHE